MILKKLNEMEGFTCLVQGNDESLEIKDIKCCDLLSWVMANGAQGDLWITVQTHANVVAVAALLEMSCIVVPSGIEMEEATLLKAKEQGVAVYASTLDAYGIFKACYEAGLKR